MFLLSGKVCLFPAQANRFGHPFDDRAAEKAAMNSPHQIDVDSLDALGLEKQTDFDGDYTQPGLTKVTQALRGIKRLFDARLVA